MRRSGVVALLVSGLMLFGAAGVPAQSNEDFRVVATFPHDSNAFTEGLDFQGRRLFEGTGLYGESDLRKVELATGEVSRQRALADRYFGEGVTAFKDRVYQLTWKERSAFVYEEGTWRKLKTFSYRGQGWGLTHNRRYLVMSNGTDQIVFRDPKTFRIERRIRVAQGGEPVQNLNELEWVKGEVLANVWPSDDVVRIDPATGKVTRRYDLSPLREAEQRTGDPDVTNGIAYMERSNRLFVTGKYWAHVYEIKLSR